MRIIPAIVAVMASVLTMGIGLESPSHANPTPTVESPAPKMGKTIHSPPAAAPEGARVPGTRTKQGPEADWVPFAALGLMVFFFVALFGLKAIKGRQAKPTDHRSNEPPTT